MAPSSLSLVASVAKTVESWRATGLPDFGASATGNFATPLANVSAEYNPPMPQGPIEPTNMVPGACVLIDQTSAAPDGLVRDWPRPSTGIERHQGYAFQWFSLAALACVFFVVTGFRRGKSATA